MTLVRHECRQARISFFIWTGVVGFLLAVCVFLFPEMKGQMEGVNALFSSMGSFTAAFGMDRLNFGTLTGYYAVECGNVLGLGGAFYAVLCGVNLLSKEEKDKTAEFLLTHPVSRSKIITDKLFALLLQVTAMNLVIYMVAVSSVHAIGETIPWRDLNLLHLAYYLLQLELAGICFGISAYLRKSGFGIGIGLAAFLYFLNLIANITQKTEFLKFVTPFGYCNAADIVADGSLDLKKISAGMVLCLLGIGMAYRNYTAKDIH